MSGATTGDVSPAAQGVFLVHLNRARRHLQEERYDVARKELELAQLARPDDDDVLNLLSVIEFKRGYYHEAAQASRALLKGSPNSPVLHSNLGLILFKAGVLGEAEQELQRAIDLQPDHVRSHLYLGLLYRMRGKLGLALEHLRFAGAKRAVAEIEKALRKPFRETSSRSAPELPPPTPRPPAGPPRTVVSPSILKLAEHPPAPAQSPAPPPPVAPARDETARVPAPAPALDETARIPARAPAHDETAPIPAALPRTTSPLQTETAPETLPFPEAETAEADLPAASAAPLLPGTPVTGPIESRPLFHIRPDGGLEVASRDVVFVRKGSVVWYSGKMRFAPEATFRGTRLEKILRADGRGYLFVHDPGRQAFRRDLNGQSLYLEGSRVLALDSCLSFRLEPIHDFRMNRRVDILKIYGRGSVILSVGGPLLSHEVSPEFPLNVSSRDLVAWTGDLIPSVLEDRFLEEVMMPDVGSAPKIRFEGEGLVLTEPPRPRRRASDLARAAESDRRS